MSQMIDATRRNGEPDFDDDIGFEEKPRRVRSSRNVIIDETFDDDFDPRPLSNGRSSEPAPIGELVEDDGERKLFEAEVEDDDDDVLIEPQRPAPRSTVGAAAYNNSTALNDYGSIWRWAMFASLVWIGASAAFALGAFGDPIDGVGGAMDAVSRLSLGAWSFLIGLAVGPLVFIWMTAMVARQAKALRIETRFLQEAADRLGEKLEAGPSYVAPVPAPRDEASAPRETIFFADGRDPEAIQRAAEDAAEALKRVEASLVDAESRAQSARDRLEAENRSIAELFETPKANGRANDDDRRRKVADFAAVVAEALVASGALAAATPVAAAPVAADRAEGDFQRSREFHRPPEPEPEPAPAPRVDAAQAERRGGDQITELRRRLSEGGDASADRRNAERDRPKRVSTRTKRDRTEIDLPSVARRRAEVTARHDEQDRDVEFSNGRGDRIQERAQELARERRADTDIEAPAVPARNLAEERDDRRGAETRSFDSLETENADVGLPEKESWSARSASADADMRDVRVDRGHAGSPPVSPPPPAAERDRSSYAGPNVVHSSPQMSSLDWVKFVRAANFPDSEDDRKTLDALYAVLTDRDAAGLLQAAEDALSGLADIGLFMEDMRPHHAPVDVWRRYVVEGDHREAMELGGVRDATAIEDVIGALGDKPDFAMSCDRFMKRYEEMVARLFRENDDPTLVVQLADTRSGRAYMLLGRSSGRFG